MLPHTICLLHYSCIQLLSKSHVLSFYPSSTTVQLVGMRRASLQTACRPVSLVRPGQDKYASMAGAQEIQKWVWTKGALKCG